MTQEKELLLKDLYARLPYMLRVKITYQQQGIKGVDKGEMSIDYNEQIIKDLRNGVILDIKPYLRPMSSMTDGERIELLKSVIGEKGIEYFQVLSDGSIDNNDAAYQDLSNFNIHWVSFDTITTVAYLDWLNAHHFDYRGLITKGLAIEVTNENNPYKS